MSLALDLDVLEAARALHSHWLNLRHHNNKICFNSIVIDLHFLLLSLIVANTIQTGHLERLKLVSLHAQQELNVREIGPGYIPVLLYDCSCLLLQLGFEWLRLTFCKL